jgi:cytochrome c biogenesis protein CcmG/thiol:disulfide interchange protein DsbE|uniref:TlpA family protein disulfide reductase n=1 Tax=Desulfobacca acetoxidans TaxID=60893 RepID=A0A7C5ALC8_9BACT
MHLKETGSRHRWLAVLLMLSFIALSLPAWAAKPAPDFTLPDVLEGKEYSLSQFKGKVVLLNFFTFFCGPCREEMPDLNKIYHENKGKGFVILGIGLSSELSQLRFLVKQLNLDYPVLAGTDKVSKDYGGVEVVPTTFIIDKQGNIVHKILGTRKKEEFEKLIKPML